LVAKVQLQGNKTTNIYNTKQGNHKHYNNIPRHAPKVFDIDPGMRNQGDFLNYKSKKNKYYEARRSNLEISSSTDSSLSIDINKRALNIRRTIANHQRSKDSSLSSSPSKELFNGEKKFYNVYSEQVETRKSDFEANKFEPSTIDFYAKYKEMKKSDEKYDAITKYNNKSANAYF